MIDCCLLRGFSAEAQFIDEAARASREGFQVLNTFAIDSFVLEELANVWQECREPNWDGYNAKPVSQDALRNAYQFLESLFYKPVRVAALPSVGAEPDGDITLEWRRSGRRNLSVSISPDGNLHYAALFGPSRELGTEAFFGEVPTRIRQLIRRTFDE